MTIQEALTRVDALKPNSYPQDTKVGWLSRIDGIIKQEIIDTHEGGEDIAFDGYDHDTNLSTKLIVSSPHDELYIKWLEAQIDYANGEIGKYNNGMAMFNAAYSDYFRHYNRLHMPKGTKLKYF